MSEHGYSILAEFMGEVPAAKLDHVTDVLLEALPPGGTVSAGQTGVDLRFSLVFDDEQPLGEIGLTGERTARRAIEEVGLHLPLEALHVQTDAALEREISTPNFPELVGLSEIAEILHVSRQRVFQLRERPDFPKPVAELRLGPVWSLPMLDRFISEWPRRVGRPAVWEEQLESDHFKEMVAGQMSKLTPREREVLKRAAAGDSVGEIASDFGVSSEAARSAIRRAMKKLRDASAPETRDS